MNILILGGTGYLGGNIVSCLSRAGHHVYCVIRPTSDTSRICQTGRGKVILLSNDRAILEDVFGDIPFDCIINGVCTYKPNATLYGDMFESNVVFPLSVLNLAIKYHVKHFITMGTGLPDDFNVYSFTKAKFADFGRFLSKKDGIGFTELKLEMFYGGEHEPEGRFLNACRRKLLAGEPLLLTDGTQKRDIVRVEDVIGVISMLITMEPPDGYQSLELGSGQQHSIRDIITHMKEVSGSESELRFGAVRMRKGEPDTLADIGWLDQIGYRLKYDYFSGLDQYMETGRNEERQ